jgi:hypothetical protein
VRPLQPGQFPNHNVSPKGMALIILCLKTFGLAICRPMLWPCILVADWCRLMCAIATTFSDDKARQAIDYSTWLLERLDHFDDTELPSIAVFAPLQSALQSALQENLACASKCGKIGCATTSLLARFFLVYDKVKEKIVEKFCRANLNVERMWKTNCALIAKNGNVLQVSIFVLLKDILFLSALFFFLFQPYMLHAF